MVAVVVAVVPAVDTDAVVVTVVEVLGSGVAVNVGWMKTANTSPYPTLL